MSTACHVKGAFPTALTLEFLISCGPGLGYFEFSGRLGRDCKLQVPKQDEGTSQIEENLTQAQEDTTQNETRDEP